MAHAFLSYCDQLWKNWLRGEQVASSFLMSKFDLNAAPEPYISFDCGANPLIVLTTNPGTTLPFQLRDAVLSGSGPINQDMEYSEASRALGRHYRVILKDLRIGLDAARRIDSFLMLSKWLGTDGVLQIETCPFHSARFPGKSAALRSFRRESVMTEYLDHLREYLRDRCVLILSAGPTQGSLSSETQLNDWLTAQVQLSNLQWDRVSFTPLLLKNGKATCGSYITNTNGVTKCLVLMMGGNRFPGEAGLSALRDALIKQNQPNTT